MNIEMVGIPGMGKSYLCRSVEQRILDERQQGNTDSLPLTTPRLATPDAGRFSSVIRKLAGAFAFACRQPLIALKLLRVIRSGQQGLNKNRCTKYVNLLAEMQYLHDPAAPLSLLTEQGVLQGVWSLEMLAQDSIYESLMRLIVPWLPDAIVLVAAESSQHKKQLVLRELGQSLFDRLQGEQLSEAIKQGEYNLVKILALWAELRPDGKRLDFNNETDTEPKVLFSWLSAQLR